MSKLLVHVFGGRRRLAKSGPRLITTTSDCCECGDDIPNPSEPPGSPNWPTHGYLLGSPCPGGPSVPRPVIFPAVNYGGPCAVGAVQDDVNGQTVRACYFVTPSSAVVELPDPLPPEYILASGDAALSCCRCREGTDLGCRSGTIDNLGAILSCLANSCPGRLTMNRTARAILVDRVGIVCCCGTPEQVSASFHDRYVEVYGGGFGQECIRTVDRTTGSLIRRENGWPVYDFITRTTDPCNGINEVAHAELSYVCSPLPFGIDLLPFSYGLGCDDWCRTMRGSITATCNSIIIGGEFVNFPDQPVIRAFYSAEARLNRGAQQCDAGCRGTDGDVGRPFRGTADLLREALG